MPRTRAFDEQDVVRAARTVFWESGYEGASLPELERVTGLARSSLYNAFGSKRGLFDAAVRSYLDDVVRPRLAPLLQEDVAADAVLGYLDGLREAILHAGSPATHGCLLINAAGAPIAHDTEVARTIAAYREELRDALLRGVRALLPDETRASASRLADTVTGLVVAAFALARVDAQAAAANLATAADLLTARRP